MSDNNVIHSSIWSTKQADGSSVSYIATIGKVNATNAEGSPIRKYPVSVSIIGGENDGENVYTFNFVNYVDSLTTFNLIKEANK